MEWNSTAPEAQNNRAYSQKRQQSWEAETWGTGSSYWKQPEKKGERERPAHRGARKHGRVTHPHGNTQTPPAPNEAAHLISAPPLFSIPRAASPNAASCRESWGEKGHGGTSQPSGALSPAGQYKSHRKGAATTQQQWRYCCLQIA